MLKTRLISALVLLPLVLAAFLYGPSWFVVVFLLISLTLADHPGV
jgi:CDP-diglyceride synthetase